MTEGQAAAAGGVDVEVSQAVYSTVPGRTGNWTVAASMRLPVLPGPGWHLAIPLTGGGEDTEVIEHVTVGPGQVRVHLRVLKTDLPGVLDGLEARGWEQLGGPWPDQGEGQAVVEYPFPAAAPLGCGPWGAETPMSVLTGRRLC